MAAIEAPVVSHGIMFHHFHGGLHPPVQGSLSAGEFGELLDWVQARHRVLPAQDFLDGFSRGSLASGDVCLTFDDALLCQAEVAAPVLAARGLTAFFFIYSSPFKGEPDLLEVYRYFRTTRYIDIEDFYGEFFSRAELIFGGLVAPEKARYPSLDYLRDFPFYTANDKWFRYLRDRVLGPERYGEVMHQLMAARGFCPQDVTDKLWMNDSHLLHLRSVGHVIGLHSYSHPTMMQNLPRLQQVTEYERNMAHLESVLGERPASMSHPCGNYDQDTLAILAGLGVRLGFRSNAVVTDAHGALEVPRQDHANIRASMRRSGGAA